MSLVRTHPQAALFKPIGAYLCDIRLTAGEVAHYDQVVSGHLLAHTNHDALRFAVRRVGEQLVRFALSADWDAWRCEIGAVDRDLLLDYEARTGRDRPSDLPALAYDEIHRDGVYVYGWIVRGA